MSAINQQYLEIYKAKPGTNAKALEKVLKEGEERIGADYLKRMKELNLIGDVSFVFEYNQTVFLISLYVFGQPPKNKPESKLIPGMEEYQKLLEPFFDDSKPFKVFPANSFWTQASIEDQLGDFCDRS